MNPGRDVPLHSLSYHGSPFRWSDHPLANVRNVDIVININTMKTASATKAIETKTEATSPTPAVVTATSVASKDELKAAALATLGNRLSLANIEALTSLSESLNACMARVGSYFTRFGVRVSDAKFTSHGEKEALMDANGLPVLIASGDNKGSQKYAKGKAVIESHGYAMDASGWHNAPESIKRDVKVLTAQFAAFKLLNIDQTFVRLPGNVAK